MAGTVSDFSKAILEEARQEAEGILDLARREAERIMEDAQGELDAIYEAESPRAATQMAKSRYKQLVAAAELDARKQLILAQERLIAEVERQIKERLLRLRRETTYPALLTQLAREGLSQLDGEQFDLIVAEEDRALISDAFLKELMTGTKKTVRLSERSEPGISGVIIQRADKRVQCDNTLQAIYRRKEEELRLMIAQQLFEGQNQTD